MDSRSFTFTATPWKAFFCLSTTIRLWSDRPRPLPTRPLLAPPRPSGNPPALKWRLRCTRRGHVFLFMHFCCVLTFGAAGIYCLQMFRVGPSLFCFGVFFFFSAAVDVSKRLTVADARSAAGVGCWRRAISFLLLLFLSLIVAKSTKSNRIISTIQVSGEWHPDSNRKLFLDPKKERNSLRWKKSTGK